MTTVIRWNPVREMMNLRHDMDRLLDRTLGNVNGDFNFSAKFMPAMDVLENDNEFIVSAVLPGINPDDLDVTLTDNTLTIRGEMPAPNYPENVTFHRQELVSGEFARSIEIGTHVDSDKVTAHYEHGILTLHIPKAEAIKPKKIAIKANGSKQKVISG